jgi:hypothetical protein
MMEAEASPDCQRRTEQTVRVRGATGEAVVDRSEASALADLQMHWDEAYAIGFDGVVWSARFHGSADELCARTSSDLRELIRGDYVHRQRPRRPAQATDGGSRAAGAGRGAGDGYAGEYGEPAGEDGARTSASQPAGDGASDDGALPERARVSAPAAKTPGAVEFSSIRGERMSM